jgi:pimeloyl-ACP methyl ester carboxylesterase
MTQTIFMIHGMWCGPWCWENYRPFFNGRGYRCLTPPLLYHDVDAHGTPDPRLSTTGLLDYVSDLEQRIRRLEEKPIIMGHSLGGLLAQLLAARIPARALVLLCPAAPAGILAITPSVLKSFWSIQTRWGFWRKPMLPSFEEAAYAAFHLLTPEEQRANYARMVHESGRVATQIGYWFLDPKRPSRVDENKITCPILVVSGQLDRITPASVVRRVARKYQPRVTYREFEDQAHWVLGQPGWQEVANYVAGWLENQAGSPLQS